MHARVASRLAQHASAAADVDDAAIDAALDARLTDGDALARLFDSAPSVAVHRHLWRRLALRERAALSSETLAVALFALPLVIVAAADAPGADAIEIPGTAGEPDAVAHVLREHGALWGNLQFAVSPALLGAEALELRRIPDWIAHGRAALRGATIAPLAVDGAPIVANGPQESVHLRFLAGSALSAPSADPLREPHVGAWGAPLARALSRALARPGVTVLALPRAPERLVNALPTGRAAQREIALQLFVSNALRRMRAGVGEPTVVLSAHRAADAPGGGELLLSLSSPFDPGGAEDFRYALQPHERVPDAVATITTLLRDCRVADVRIEPAIRDRLS